MTVREIEVVGIMGYVNCYRCQTVLTAGINKCLSDFTDMVVGLGWKTDGDDLYYCPDCVRASESIEGKIK